MRKFIFTAVIIAISAAGGFFIGQQTKSAASSEPAKVSDDKKPDLVKFIQDENILSLTSWEDDDGKTLFGVIRQLDKPCSKDSGLSTCQQFSIYDENNKAVNVLKDFQLHFVGQSRFKPNSFQLILERNGGGTDNSLSIIDYKNGKFTELLGNSETQYRGGYWWMPEYGSKNNGAYFKPVQLIAIKQIGGSDNAPNASVFRFKNNKFQQVGEIQMQELGDFIEAQLNKKAK